MPIDRSLVELMPHTATLALYSSQNDYGEPSWGSGTDYTCRVVNRIREVRTDTGETKISTATVLLDRAVTAGPRDKITLPDGSTPKILAVETYPIESGNYYTAILTGPV